MFHIIKLGPLYVTEDLKLEARNITWNEKYGLLFIDQPVWTGFSYSNPGYLVSNLDLMGESFKSF
jgi:vitellogenic carboxypeptidase-like protein